MSPWAGEYHQDKCFIPERVDANPHYNQHQNELKHNGRVLLCGTFLSQPHSKSLTSFPPPLPSFNIACMQSWVTPLTIISQSQVTQALFEWVDEIVLNRTMNKIMIDCQSLFKVLSCLSTTGCFVPWISIPTPPTSFPSRFLKPQPLF